MGTAACYLTTTDGQTFVVVDGMIHLPRLGVWHADLTLDAPGSADADTVLSGAATVTLGAVSYSGTLGLNGPTQRDTIRARVNGGAGGLGKVFGPKGYRATTLQIVIGDILAAAGETASNTADPAITATNVPHWIAMQQPCGLALQSVLQVVGASWRVLADGTVWFGTETYPPATQADFVQIHNEPELARYEFGSYAPTLLPGTTFLEQRVSAVIHYIRPSGVSSQALYE